LTKIGTVLGHETGKGRRAASPKLCSEKQELRFFLLQCHTPPHGSTLFAAKRPLKEEKGLLAFCLLWLYFGLFGVGSFWKGKELLKGKIVEGKMLKRG
jgi:hypothetical protein